MWTIGFILRKECANYAQRLLWGATVAVTTQVAADVSMGSTTSRRDSVSDATLWIIARNARQGMFVHSVLPTTFLMGENACSVTTFWPNARNAYLRPNAKHAKVATT